MEPRFGQTQSQKMALSPQMRVYLRLLHLPLMDLRQAVEDEATRPLYYESHIIKLKVDEEGARVAEEEVEYVVNADRCGEAAEGRIRVPLESLVGAQEEV